MKFILIVFIAAGAMFELGSPLWTRSAAAGAAQDAASAAARDYFTSFSLDSAKVAASNAAQVRGDTLKNIQLQPDGSFKVTVAGHARSYVLHHVSALKNWYNVTATATAPPLRA